MINKEMKQRNNYWPETCFSFAALQKQFGAFPDKPVIKTTLLIDNSQYNGNTQTLSYIKKVKPFLLLTNKKYSLQLIPRS